MAFQFNLKSGIAVFLATYTVLQLILIQYQGKRLAPLKQRLHSPERLTVTPSVTMETKEHREVFSSRNRPLDTPAMTARTQRSNCGSDVKLLLGHQRQSRGFLTIGLCTVPRPEAFYLKDTLDSLINQMTDPEKEKVVIVVFMGYHNKTLVKETLRVIEYNFNHSLRTGVLQVVQPDIGIYPNFSQITKRTFNDSFQRVKWRTKQNIDFAYLFGYSEKFSDYYMHVEDDVTTVASYISQVQSVLSNYEKLHKQWFVLDFGPGFIGKLFRSSHLCMMKTYLLLFQEEKPCDVLLPDLQRIMIHDLKKATAGKTLFKHFGKYSTLEGKIFEDKHVKRGKKTPLPINAEKVYISRLSSNQDAIIETSMKTYLNFTPEMACEINNKVYFWATTPKVNDYYRVILKFPVLSSRVSVRTGAPVTGKDRLESAKIFVNNHLMHDGSCRNLSTPLGTLYNGKFEYKFLEPKKLKCLEIVVTKTQMHWVIISQIEIET